MSPRSYRAAPLSILVLKLLSLFAACGGPMVLYDLMRPTLGGKLGFAIMFAPIALMLMGGFSLTDADNRDGLDRAFIWCGLLGVALLAVYNLLAGAYWFHGARVASPGLVGLGAAVGVLASYLYVRRARVALSRRSARLQVAPQQQSLYSGPRADDWAVLVIGLGFVGMGLFLLPKHPKGALVTLVLFGTCAYVGYATVARKRRYAHGRTRPMSFAGGRTLKPSRGRLVAIGALTCGLGLLVVFLADEYPWLFRAIAAVVSAIGLLVAVGALVRKLPSLTLSATGLTVGGKAFSTLIPWDAIAAVSPGELFQNAVLFVEIGDLEQVRVSPESARERALRQFESNRRQVGAHVMLMTWQYGVDLPVLAAAVAQYSTNPAAREELIRPAPT